MYFPVHINKSLVLLNLLNKNRETCRTIFAANDSYTEKKPVGTIF